MGSQLFVKKYIHNLCPHRLDGQDAALSRRWRGFESRWGYARFQRLCLWLLEAGMGSCCFYSYGHNLTFRYIE